MVRQGFTSLVVVAPKLEPTALLTALMPLLNPSASVAVYASSLPPLAECFQKLHATRNFAALHVCPRLTVPSSLMCHTCFLCLVFGEHGLSSQNSTQACGIAVRYIDVQSPVPEVLPLSLWTNKRSAVHMLFHCFRLYMYRHRPAVTFPAYQVL